MKTKLLIPAFLCILAACFVSPLQAQTFEEYKRQQQEQMQQYEQQQAQQLAALAAQFTEYVKQQDAAYSNYLKQRWEEFQVFRGETLPQEPKPEEAPVFTPDQRPAPPRPIPAKAPEDIKKKPESPQFIKPRIIKPDTPKSDTRQVDFLFYGMPVVFDLDAGIARMNVAATIDENAVAGFFDQMSQTSYNHLLSQIYEYSALMNLNDWGTYMLIKKMAVQLTDDINQQRLLTWYLLVRGGYKAKVAFADNQIFLLLPISNQVYDVNYFTIDNQKYYVMDAVVTNVFTYEKDYPESQKTVSLDMVRAVDPGAEPKERIINFSYNGQEYNIPLSYNQHAIDFYSDIPLADVRVYFDAMVSPEAKTSIAAAFAPLIQGLDELQAVSLLLHFVQTGFAYQTDDEQFGREKFFFAEEAFYYPYCDCEDRSVLFAYLVKSLLGLEAVGLNYPGHMAVAVHFSQPVEGNYVMVDDKKFVVADPTYINAPVGLAMPEFADVSPVLVPIHNNFFVDHQHNALWQEVIAAGGSRGDNGHDMILNGDGSQLVAGYFTQSFSLGTVQAEAGEQPVMFVMKTNKDNQPAWFSHSRGTGMAMAYGLTGDAKSNIYVAGTYNGEMEIDGRKISSNTDGADVFVAAFTPNGKLKWLQKANIDTANLQGSLTDQRYSYLIRFDKEGKALGNEVFPDNNDFDNFGIFVTDAGEIAVTGAFGKTTGMNNATVSYASTGDFDAVQVLKSENDRLIDERYEKTIAGLFAVITVAQSNGMVIPGSEAQQAIDKYNPGFKSKSPQTYNMISRVQFIKNQQGVITLKTDNEKDINIDMMRVSNDARLKIVMLDSGDARIDVLSGIKVGKAIWWYNLNSITLYKATGDLLFDYDSDHAQARKNLKKDILY
jgi:hypothetical protein